MLRQLVFACVERRLAALFVVAVIGAYGLHAFRSTAIEAYPDVTNLQVNVIAKAPGLAPEEVERQVTAPLERVLNGTPGMIGMRSESLFGLSLVFITFGDDADPFRSRAYVTERASTAELPDWVDVELAPNATPLGEVFQYRLESDRHSLYDLRAAQEFVASRVLREIPGVAEVISFGGYLEELHVEVDPVRLRAHGLTLREVSDALASSNLNVGGGILRQGEQELMVRSIGFIRGARDIENVVLHNEGGTPVTVGDVARVVQSHTPRRGTVGYDLELEVVQGFVLLRRGENPSLVLEAIHAKVDELNEGMLPEGMRIAPFYDRSVLVGQTLSTVRHNLLFGAILIVSVVWLFLRSVRGSLIVAAVIPMSLLSAFIGLYLLGLPANLISMGAIDFGIIVDGAVILVENVIHRSRTRQPRTRRERLQLITNAAVEVARPTLYAMAIIIAALIPVFALERVEGRIFRPLALTYAFALLAALVLALTLVPALCALLMKGRQEGHAEPRFIEALRRWYGHAVRALLRWRVAALGGAMALLVAGGLVGSNLGREFLPALDEGDINIFVELPSSISLEEGQLILRDVRARLLEFPEVRGTLSRQGRPEDGTDNEGVNMSETAARLLPRDEWRPGWTKERLIEAMRASLAELPGVRFNFSQPIQDNIEEATAGVRGQVVLKIFGADMEAMRETLERAKAELAGIDGVVDLDLYRDTMVPQLQIELDRDALARAGISVADAQEVVETALAGKIVTSFYKGERPVPIRVRLPRNSDGIEEIRAISMPAPDGGHIPLAELARVGLAPGRLMITRESNSRMMALKFNVEGRDLGSVIDEAMAVVQERVPPPEDHYFAWGGEFENQQRAMERLRTIVPIALFLVLCLLYSSLKSARGALTILAIVPFAATGGIFALALAGVVLSVSAAIGFIALLGQISLAGLLVLTAIDERRRDGDGLYEAIIGGSVERLRAVLMLGLLAMLGLLPMAVSTAVGSETQRPFALVIIGGMVTTVAITLFVLPVIYSLVAPKVLRAGDEEDA